MTIQAVQYAAGNQAPKSVGNMGGRKEYGYPHTQFSLRVPFLCRSATGPYLPERSTHREIEHDTWEQGRLYLMYRISPGSIVQKRKKARAYQLHPA
jgi:hypothetical protein